MCANIAVINQIHPPFSADFVFTVKSCMEDTVLQPVFSVSLAVRQSTHHLFVLEFLKLFFHHNSFNFVCIFYMLHAVNCIIVLIYV